LRGAAFSGCACATLLTAGNRVSGGVLQVAYRRIQLHFSRNSNSERVYFARAPGKFEWTGRPQNVSRRMA